MGQLPSSDQAERHRADISNVVRADRLRVVQRRGEDTACAGPQSVYI